MKQEQLWRKFNGQYLQAPIFDEVQEVFAQAKAEGTALKVCIGTDSQVKHGKVYFATVILFVRKGKGGFMYIKNTTSNEKPSIKERMLKEVAMSIEIAYELLDLFVAFNVDMEVHADINTSAQFKSNTALKDAMGYIMGMGFAFKAKPEAFASSSCADKVV
jgi:uncharacterized protein